LVGTVRAKRFTDNGEVGNAFADLFICRQLRMRGVTGNVIDK